MNPVRLLVPAMYLTLGLPGCAIAQPPVSNLSAGLRIVSFGDSTTALRQTVKQVYSDRLPDILGDKGIRAEVFNAGISGDTTTRAAKRFTEDVMQMEPDVVVIQFGLNDSAVDVQKNKSTPRVSLGDYRSQLRNFVQRLRQAGIGVVLMTPNPGLWTKNIKKLYGKPPYRVDDPWGFNIYNKSYAAAARKLASQLGVSLVDVYREFEGYGIEKTRSYLSDGLHPNDLGHQWLAEKIAKTLIDSGLAQQKPRRKRNRLHSRAYSIPLIDLASEKHRQILVDRERGQYLGHPTTVLLEDNKTMICVYPKGHGRGAVVMKRSTDAGRTWSERLPTPASWATSKEVPTIHRVIDKQGVKRLIMFSGLYPIRMAVSEDDGATWSELKKIGNYGGIVTMGCVIRLKNGDYMALFHDDGRFIGPKRRKQERMLVYKILSKDGGLTWNAPTIITSHPIAHLCEPGYARSPDGNEIAVFLRENSRRRNGHVIFSRDEGATWTAPRELPAALTGDRHTARYAPDGRLFITFRDTTLISPTKGDWVAWVGTYDDIVQGREGQYRVRLMDNQNRWDCAYPGLELLPDGTLVTTTYGHWDKGAKPYIVSVRLKLSELDERAKAAGNKR
ncbi:MAG: GDSL-type esterase/lipase family protein [Planctomycetota bacterium]|nr:GDSL-type esterase/lipase family protein [Planctomycetota bacterium]